MFYVYVALLPHIVCSNVHKRIVPCKMILQDDTIQVFYQIVSNRKIERQQNPPKTIFLIVK